jgi:hypothetical protein
LLDLLEGDASGEARCINQDSTIVGWSDDPPGPEGFPESVQWDVEGKVKKIDAGKQAYLLVNAINDAGFIAGSAIFDQDDQKPEADTLLPQPLLAFRGRPISPNQNSSAPASKP